MGKKSLWIVFILALLVRLIDANQSFWLDEGASIVIARLPLGSLLTALQGDFHPPLFYLLLHFWLPLAGRAEWLIRLPNIIIGAATVPLLYFFLIELLGESKRRVAFLAALLLLFNPLHIYYSMELRMYSLNAFLSLFSWFFLVRAAKTKKTLDWLVFALISVGNFYTFYGAVFNLGAQWLYAIFVQKNRQKQFLAANVGIILAFLPWLPTFLTQLSGSGYLTSVLPGWKELSGNLSPKSLGLIMAKFTFGRITLANKTAYAVFVAGISLYFLLCSFLSSLHKQGRALLFWFYGSLALAILVSLYAPVLGYWRFVFLIPVFVSLIALGLSHLPSQALTLNLILVFLVFFLGNYIFWTTPSLQREDWRAAAKLISADRSVTIVNFPDTFAPLKFYAPDVYYYPDQISLGKMRPDLDQSLPLVLKDKQTVFVLDYLSDLSDPKRSILTWLKEAGFKQNPTHNINGVGFVYEFTSP